MSRPRVAIAHGEDPKAMVHQALALIEAPRVVRRDDRVVLKPNYVEPHDPGGLDQRERLLHHRLRVFAMGDGDAGTRHQLLLRRVTA